MLVKLTGNILFPNYGIFTSSEREIECKITVDSFTFILRNGKHQKKKLR